MSKIILTNLVDLQNETTAVNAINNNNTTLETAFDNTLSRDGTSPNQMTAALDMNSNHILNLPTPTTPSDPIRLSDVDLLNGSGTINVSTLPAGGTTGQLLGKNSGTNFDASWKNVSDGVIAGAGISITGTTPVTVSLNSSAVLPVGGSTGQVLSKTSSANYAVAWVDEGGSTPNFNVKTYGATGDGSTDDTTAIQAAVTAMIAAGGGTLFFPAPSVFYKTTGTILIDLSAISTRFQSRVHILGDSPGKSMIKNVVSNKIISYIGSSSNVEAYLGISSIRLLGNNVAGSVGLSINKAAYIYLSDLVVEGMDLGLDLTDVDQIGFYDSEIRFNNGGIRGNAAISVTDPNSWSFFNVAVANNATYGLQINNANSLAWFGGSIQYNGVIGGGSGQYGIKMVDTGSGYGNVIFSGMAFEGNGGLADFVSQQTGAGAQHCNITFDSCSFIRTGTFGGVGYGTNQINISGTGANANYKIINSNFYGFAPYAASAGRPAIANTNTNAKVEIDGLTTFWSNTEAPASSALYTGAPGSRTGSISFAGVTSGATVLQAQSTAAGTLTLPAITDTVVTRNNTETLTNKTLTSPGLTGTVLMASAAGGTAAGSTMTLASTTSGAPSGDSVSLIGTSINLNGKAFQSWNSAVWEGLTLTNTNATSNSGISMVTNGHNAQMYAIFSGGILFRADTSTVLTIATNGNATFPGLIFAAQGVAGGSAANSTMTVASTSSGAPSGDILSLFGSTIKLNGSTTLKPTSIAFKTFDIDAAVGQSIASGSNFPLTGIAGQPFTEALLVNKFDYSWGYYVGLPGFTLALMLTDATAKFVAPTTTPAAGKCSLAYNGSNLAIYNNTGNTGTFNGRITIIN